MSEASEIYFRLCWMTLKAEASNQLRAKMDRIEVDLCGLSKKPSMKLTERRPNESDPSKLTAV